MQDLIFKDETLKSIREMRESASKQISDNPLYTIAVETLVAIEDEINRKQAVDAAPIIRAHWFITEYEYLDCSNCGKSYYTGAESTKDAQERLSDGNYFAYCPHCGAKMDKCL